MNPLHEAAYLWSKQHCSANTHRGVMHGHVRESHSQIGSSGHRSRLRQRLFEGGPKALLDHELVEYLLALAIPRRDTKAQARALIARFGGVGPLLAADAEALKREGLTEGWWPR